MNDIISSGAALVVVDMQVGTLANARSQADELVGRRAAWSAFANTELHEHLAAAEVSQVVIVGIATTFGVESTARAAADLGYDVVVIPEAVADPDPAGHERTLTRVIPALGRVLPLGK